MKSKIFGLFGLSVLVLVILMSAVSATECLNLTEVSVPQNVTEDQGSFIVYFNLLQKSACSVDRENLNWTITSNKATWDGLGLPSSISEGDTKELSATFNFDTGQTGNIEITIYVIDDEEGDEATLILSPITIIESTEPEPEIPEEITDCSAIGDNGDLSIEIDDITVTEGFGDDDEFWYLFDEIEIEIKVENENNDYDIDDIEIAWGLYDKNAEEFIIDDEENDFNLKDGDDKTVIIKFDLDNDVDDFEDADLVFYVWANGVLDDDAETKLCASDSQTIEVETDDDFVIINDFKINSAELDDLELISPVLCGAELQFSADVWNIGEDEQDDVYVRIYNQELGINEKVEIGDIDAFEDEELSITITIPQDADEKYYTLIFTVYDEDNDVYETEEDEDESEFNILIKVQGGCSVDEPTAVVSANLESGGEAGEELVIKAVITNTGDELTVYSLSLTGYSDWADLSGIEPSTVALSAGESKEVLVTLNVNADVSGDKSFNIEVLSENEVIKIFTVDPVSIEKSEPTGLSGITGNVISGGSWYLWAIGALNILLIIIIIIVAVRVSKN